MKRSDVNKRLLPATRYKEFPVLKHKLKGHWGIYLDSYYHPELKERVETLGVGRIEEKRGDTVKIGHKRCGLHTVWVIPEHVPVDKHWPRGEWLGFFKNLTRDEAAAVLTLALTAADAPEWFNELEERQR